MTNWYAQFSMPRVYAFSTFFFGDLVEHGPKASKASKWTQKVDIFGFDVLLVPVHVRCHWQLVIVDLRKSGNFKIQVLIKCLLSSPGSILGPFYLSSN